MPHPIPTSSPMPPCACRPNLVRTLADLQIEDGEELVVTDPVFTREASLLLEIRFT